MFGKEKIPAIQAQIAEKQAQLQQSQGRAATWFAHGQQQSMRLKEHFEPQFNTSIELLRRTVQQHAPAWVSGWQEMDRWDGWEISESIESSVLRIGDLIEQRDGNKSLVPGFIPFIGQNRAVIIRVNNKTSESGLQLLQSLLIRTALLLPHQARYTLVDPAGAGRSFPMRRDLPQVRENSGDVRRDLEGVMVDIQRVIETYLSVHTTSFEQVPHTIRLNEPYQFVFAADFPKNYDRRAIEALQAIANTGGVAGVYLFIHHNVDYELPRDISMSSFENQYLLSLENGSPSLRGLRLQADSVPDPDLQKRLFETIRSSKPPERTIHWQDMKEVATEIDHWWKGDATRSIAAQIGIHGSDSPLRIWFGVQDGRPCAHGMLGAMTGAGKSNVYHVMIAGLTTAYSPEELRLYLIDGKDGVEFQPYRRLPHAEVVSLRSSPELSRSVLAELVNEKERRNDLFTRTGTRDFLEYRAKGQPLGPMPRILLLVDEYQELFDGDRDGVASGQLLQLAQQGRSAGIHMFLGSQHFGAVGMLNRQQVFDNFHLRAAMQMASDAVQALTEFGRKGKGLIASTCDLPGKIVINDRSGDDSGNAAGKVAFLHSDLRDTVIENLQKKGESYTGDLPARIIFDGKKQPVMTDNPQLAYLLHRDRWLTATELEELARRPLWDDGFNTPGWFAGEMPRAAWLGQDFSVRGQAMLILRRRIGENSIVVGDANAERYGMLASILVSLALNAPPTDSCFITVDCGIPGTPWGDTLRDVSERVLQPAGFDARYIEGSRGLEPLLSELTSEIDRRMSLSPSETNQQPAIYIAGTEFDRVDSLRRQVGNYGMATDSALSVQLNRVIVEGPPVGIHVVLSFSGVRPMSSVVDARAGLDYFRHRIATQMAEDASHTLIRSRLASRLQVDGPVPVCALYFDIESDTAMRFKPYTTKLQADEQVFKEQLSTIGNLLVGRKEDT